MFELLADPTVWAAVGGVASWVGLKTFAGRKPKEQFSEHGYRIGYSAHYTRQLEIQEFGTAFTDCRCQYCEDQARIENERAKALERDLAEAQRKHEWEQKRLAQRKNEYSLLAGNSTRAAKVWCKYCQSSQSKKGAYALPSGLWACAPCYQNRQANRSQKCSKCRVPLDYDGWCSNGCVESYRLSLTEKPEKRERIIDGKTVSIPPEVPDYAHAKLVYDPHYMSDCVMWRWTDKSTGFEMGRRQVVIEIRDPETKEHLGMHEVKSDQSVKPVYKFRSVP